MVAAIVVIAAIVEEFLHALQNRKRRSEMLKVYL